MDVINAMRGFCEASVKVIPVIPFDVQQRPSEVVLENRPRHRPAEETLPSDGQCNAAPCYSLNATPLNAATPAALDVATWVKSP